MEGRGRGHENSNAKVSSIHSLVKDFSKMLHAQGAVLAVRSCVLLGLLQRYRDIEKHLIKADQEILRNSVSFAP